MLKKLILVVLVAAAAVFGVWRLGLLDERRVKDEAAELRERAEESARRAAEETAKRAREAVDDATRR